MSEELDRLVAPWARSRFGVFHDDGRFEELTDAEAETHPLGGRARCVGGAHDAQLVRCALLAAAREADSLREQCNVAARVASDAMREAEEWKAKALRWDAERQIVAGHYDDVRADYLELREWRREVAEWFRGELDRSRATEGFLRALLARVKP